MDILQYARERIAENELPARLILGIEDENFTELVPGVTPRTAPASIAEVDERVERALAIRRRHLAQMGER